MRNLNKILDVFWALIHFMAFATLIKWKLLSLSPQQYHTKMELGEELQKP